MSTLHPKAHDSVMDAHAEGMRSANDTPRPNRHTSFVPSANDSPGPPGPPVPEKDTIAPGRGALEAGKKGKKWKLEEVERWTMVKRIW